MNLNELVFGILLAAYLIGVNVSTSLALREEIFMFCLISRNVKKLHYNVKFKIIFSKVS